jgi:hypothetical protein
MVAAYRVNSAPVIHPLQMWLYRWIAGLALVVASLWGRSLLAEKPPQLNSAQIEQLTRDGDRLADQGDYVGALEKYTRAYMGTVSSIRGQAFVKAIEPHIFTREELGQEMRRMLDEEYTDEELALMDATYKVFGFAPPAIDTGRLLTDMLTEEVAGFYDSDKKRMVLIVGEGPREEPGWLGRLLGVKPAFEKEEQKSTLAHELTHALQDQLYDLSAMQEAIEDDDDMLLAFSALVEGDATLLMFAEMDEGTDITEMDPNALRATFRIMNWLLPLAGGESMRKAPAIFRETLIFPYFDGLLFVLELAAEEGWLAVDAAYRAPPLSTEQILHPEKYLSDTPDVPQKGSLPDLSDWTSEHGWVELGGNVLGEFQLRILFKGLSGGNSAAAGWDGDRYSVFKKDDKLAVACVSVWDSPRDATEFMNMYAKYREVDHRPDDNDSDESQLQHPTSNPDVFISQSVHRIVRNGNRVVIVEGLPAELATPISAALKEATFTEKKFPLPDPQGNSASIESAPASGDDR